MEDLPEATSQHALQALAALDHDKLHGLAELRHGAMTLLGIAGAGTDAADQKRIEAAAAAPFAPREGDRELHAAALRVGLLARAQERTLVLLDGAHECLLHRRLAVARELERDAR